MEDIEAKVINLYEVGGHSTYEIAEMMETYPNKIRRILKKRGHKLKTRSEAQSSALRNGRSKHPTEGKERPLEQRLKISTSLIDYWSKIQKDEYDRRCAQAKANWANLTEQQKDSMRAKAITAIRAAATDGSKLERFIHERVEEAGYFVETHKMLIPAEELEIDLLIPKLKTIIEVDGPSHFLPIWGEDKLQKQINADLRKSGVILSRGFVIIRVKSLGQETLAKKEDLIAKVLHHIDGINISFPPESQRFIEVE
jgi:very-short-patch-repair endonuclease